jgi:hypothetical protein
MTHNPATPFNTLASTGFSLGGDAVGVTVMDGGGGCDSSVSAALAATGSSDFDRFGFCSDTDFSSFLPASSALRFYNHIG